MIVDIVIAILDKLLPGILKKFIPLVKVRPNKFVTIKSDWHSNFSFFLYNRHKEVLFDVYLLVEIGTAKTEDFKIVKAKPSENLKISVESIEINYDVVRLDCIYDNGEEFIMLKIAQMDPLSFTPFQITADASSKVKLRVLKYSKKQSAILNKQSAGAIQFEIPFRSKQRIQLKNVGLIMRKNIN